MSENNEILFNNEYFMKSLSTIININKELEKELYSKLYDEKEDFLKDNINKTIINSIFSLLNFQITLISQLTELNSKFSKKSEINQQKIIEKLVNFTKELLYQKIKQIVILYHNNIIYKNYIDNSSLLKINNDKYKKKKNLFNLNESNIFINNNNSLEINNKSKNHNKILDKELDIKNNDKNQINLKNSNEKENKNEKKIKFQTPIKYVKIYKRTIFTKNNKKGNIQNNNINNKKKLNNNVSHNCKTTKLSKNKIKNQIIKHRNTHQDIVKINNNVSQEEINPIRKIKNIIKNIKINISLSNKKYKNNSKRNNNIFSHDKNINSIIFNYSNDSMIYQDSRLKNSFSYHETENNEKVEKSLNNKINKREIETSYILNECMNNVKKRLAIENEKNNKIEEQKNLTDRNIYEYKNMKNHKIKKQLCISLYKNK